MPFVTVTLAAPALTAEQVSTLHRSVTDLMAKVLRKRAELTAVLIEETTSASWRVGDQPVVCAAHIEARVTAGTNSPEEKARFIGLADILLRRVLGDGLPLATYVVVQEVAADAWGYGGLTQEHRRLTGQGGRAPTV